MAAHSSPRTSFICWLSIFCSQMLCHLHWHTYVTLYHVYKHSLESSICRSLKISPMGSCKKSRAVQFVPLCMCFYSLKKIRSHYI
jgi:hypothetical protein